MKVLTATTAGQGAPGDYAWTVEGELVRFGLVCARDAQRPLDDLGGCGCARGFAGLSSSRATTTALVRDLALTPAEVRTALEAALVREGWLGEELSAEDHAELDSEVEQLLRVAGEFPVGAVLERRTDLVRARGLSAA